MPHTMQAAGAHHPSQPVRERIAAWVKHAAHHLPEQAPLHAFVHHNTLHAFEHLPFHEGVEQAAALYGTVPYPAESRFAHELQTGRITRADVEAVVRDEKLDDAALFDGGPTRAELWTVRLLHPFDVPGSAALSYMLHEDLVLGAFDERVPQARREAMLQEARAHFPGHEDAALTRHTLDSLWQHIHRVTPSSRKTHKRVRRRDDLRLISSVDIDTWVQPVLVRLCSAYLDQGVSYWSMPEREKGLLHAFRNLYGRKAGPPDRFLRTLPEILRWQTEQGMDAQATIAWTLAALRIPEASWEAHIFETLQTLRGWAGMIHQFEMRPDKAPVRAVPATLMDYLAVQLTLELLATRTALKDVLGASATFDDLAQRASEAQTSPPKKNLALAYETFVVAQLLDVKLADLEPMRVATALVNEVAALPSLVRRRLLHKAYERHHVVEVMDAMAAQLHHAPDEDYRPSFQAVFCIDDREESFRRHLEEVEPDCETFGYPGFFGVPMKYQGAHDIRARGLCPAAMQPTHFVRETGEQNMSGSLRSRVERALMPGSATLGRGFLVSLLGMLSTVPLVLSVLFPRAFRFKRGLAAPGIDARTHLHFRHEGAHHDGLPEGFTPEEMTGIVQKMLRELGMVSNFADLVLVIGHGSTSINNPHVAAYGCGATAGGCGGPNGRVLAAMANDPATRDMLRARGIDIPERTFFVGGVHDTCTDDVLFYDEHLVPEALDDQFTVAKAQIELAAQENARERCRLFGVVPLDVSARAAKAIVERRSVDLSEARPEYNHAKNSLAIVGERKWTRGLFLDQRAFLVSYDPKQETDGAVLLSVLRGSVPVGVGINLEYFFSHIDNAIYGSGSKLPHNIAGMLGVMDGHGSDLRTGLYHQMIELHEPVRMLALVQASPQRLTDLLERDANIKRLVLGGWLHVAAFDPEARQLWLLRDGEFTPYEPEQTQLREVDRSIDAYKGTREPVACTHIRGAYLRRAS